MNATWEPDTEGIFNDLPADEYHASPGVSNSMLKHLARSPAHLRHYMLHGMAQTKPMLLGSVLEIELGLEAQDRCSYIVRPADIDGRTKAGKEWIALHADQDILTSDEWGNVVGMRDAVRAHATAAEAIGNGASQVSIYKRFECEPMPVLRRGRLDVQTEGNSLVDLKSAQDASPGGFARQAANLKYYMQAAYYLDLWNDSMPDDRKEFFVFVVVESSAPYCVGVYQLEEDAIRLGRAEYVKHLETYSHCIKHDTWPGYGDEVMTLKLPKWAYMT